MDLVADLAGPLPVLVIAELLGLRADRDRIRAWSDDLVGIIDPLNSPVGLGDLDRTFGAFLAYLREAFEDRRREPRDDLVSALVAAEEQGGPCPGRALLRDSDVLEQVHIVESLAGTVDDRRVGIFAAQDR